MLNIVRPWKKRGVDLFVFSKNKFMASSDIKINELLTVKNITRL